MGVMGLAVCMIWSNRQAVILKPVLNSWACKYHRHGAEAALALRRNTFNEQQSLMEKFRVTQAQLCWTHLWMFWCLMSCRISASGTLTELLFALVAYFHEICMKITSSRLVAFFEISLKLVSELKWLVWNKKMGDEAWQMVLLHMPHTFKKSH